MTQQMTIGQLADAAGVNVETVRYYQRRELLAQPHVRRAVLVAIRLAPLLAFGSSSVHSRSGFRWTMSKHSCRSMTGRLAPRRKKSASTSSPT
jgi:hypothetical protein